MGMSCCHRTSRGAFTTFRSPWYVVCQAFTVKFMKICRCRGLYGTIPVRTIILDLVKMRNLIICCQSQKTCDRHENTEKQLKPKCDIHVMKQLDMGIQCLEDNLQHIDDDKLEELEQMCMQISGLNSKLETVKFEVTSNEENTKWSDTVSQAIVKI